MHTKHHRIFIFPLLLLANSLAFVDKEAKNTQKTLITARLAGKYHPATVEYQIARETGYWSTNIVTSCLQHRTL